MTFADEDELAIHTVAAGAYRILRDLLEKRGRSGLEESVALEAGELTQAELENLTAGAPEFHESLIAISEDIKTRGSGVAPA